MDYKKIHNNTILRTADTRFGTHVRPMTL